MDGGRANWVVVLEPAVGADDRSLHPVLEVLADSAVLAIYCLDRFAVEIETDAAEPAEALSEALSRLHSAFDGLGQPFTEIVRAEVISRDEFERESHRPDDGSAILDDAEDEYRVRLLLTQ